MRLLPYFAAGAIFGVVIFTVLMELHSKHECAAAGGVYLRCVFGNECVIIKK